MKIKKYISIVVTNIAILTSSQADESPFFKLPTQFGLDKENRALADKVSSETNASIKELAATVAQLTKMEVTVNAGIQEQTAKSVTEAATQAITTIDQSLKNHLQELDRITDKTVKMDINFTNTEAATRLVKTTAVSLAGLSLCAFSSYLLFKGITHAFMTKPDSTSKGSFKDYIAHPYTHGLLMSGIALGGIFGGIKLIAQSDSLVLKFPL